MDGSSIYVGWSVIQQMEGWMNGQVDGRMDEWMD